MACSQNQIMVSPPTLLVKCSVRIHQHLKSIKIWCLEKKPNTSVLHLVQTPLFSSKMFSFCKVHFEKSCVCENCMSCSINPCQTYPPIISPRFGKSPCFFYKSSTITGRFSIVISAITGKCSRKSYIPAR